MRLNESDFEGGYNPHINAPHFLSHSSKDKTLAHRLATDIKISGIDVWFDEWEIEIGQSISQKVQLGLKEARQQRFEATEPAKP